MVRSLQGYEVRSLGLGFARALARSVSFTGSVLLLFAAGGAGAAPANWVRYDQGLTFDWQIYVPKLFTFNERVYAEGGTRLFVQLYNAPCLGWREVTVPALSTGFKALGSHLYATATDLWWIATGDHNTVPTWKQVSSTGLPAGAAVYPQAVFQGQLYARVSNTSGTFDVYRTADIGKTTMAWTKVVDAGFGDPLNHELGVLIEYNNKLIAVTSNTRTDPSASFGDQRYYGTGIEVWESASGDLGSWIQVNLDGFGTEVTVGTPPVVVRPNQDSGSAVVYGGNLYVGTLAHWNHGEVWRYNGGGLGGWTEVTPDGMCATTLGCGGPSRAMGMVVYNGLLYLAEGFPTANLETFDGTTWTIVVGTEDPNDLIVGHPFDVANIGILSLGVLPSRPTLDGGWTGDKLFSLTMMHYGGIQVWSYPFSKMPLTSEALDVATITITPQSATSELYPGATHTFTVKVDAGSSFDFADVWVPLEVRVEQHYGGGGSVGVADGWVPASGLTTETYPAQYVEPSGLTTDNIMACFFTPERSVCATATHTWADTTPPAIVITTPANGAEYLLNASVIAAFTVQDAVGVASVTATVPAGGAVPTSTMGSHTFSVTATDYAGNTVSASVTYQVLTPPQAVKDLGSTVASSSLPAGLKNGFEVKLMAALDSLSKGRTQAAIQQLEAFINLVNAQQGKALTDAEADSWIAQAQAIINSIKAS